MSCMLQYSHSDVIIFLINSFPNVYVFLNYSILCGLFDSNLSMPKNVVCDE